MLTEVFPFLLPTNIENDLPSKMRRLGDDLDRLRSGIGPTGAELAGAPLIEDWHAVLTPMGLRLTGFVSGHPGFSDRSTIISQLWAADASGRWVRTLSRFYRLGRIADADMTDAESTRHLDAGIEGMLSDV